MLEPDNEARSAPKLNIVPIDKPLGFFDCFGIVRAAQRLNSNETKIAPRSVWIAVNGSDLSAPTFMVSSKMDGSDPHFDAESIATHNTSWDLEKDDVQADPATLPGKADTAG